MAPGVGALLGALTLASIRRFPKPHYLLSFLTAGFGYSIVFFALALIFRSRSFLFLAGGFPDHLSFLGRNVAPNVQR
jgi:hypothetical protein